MTEPNRDQASRTTTQPSDDQGERKPRLPHERDESADSQTEAAPREIIKQAHDDVESGKEDTDLRGTGGRREPAVPSSKDNP